MEKKSKVKTCKCGAGIPLYSPHDICYNCLKQHPNQKEAIEVLKQTIKKDIKPIEIPNPIKKKKPPKVESIKQRRKKSRSH